MAFADNSRIPVAKRLKAGDLVTGARLRGEAEVEASR